MSKSSESDGDIASDLEREFTLRRFNKDALKMDETEGSDLKRIIGVSVRRDKETGQTFPVSDAHPSHFTAVRLTFERYPVYKHYGITIADAMAMPVDQWYELKRNIVNIEEPETELTVALQLVKQLVSLQGGGE